jgi:FolB domain-containing protein
MDLIKIVGLRCECTIGTFAHERTQKQPVFLNITLTTDLKQAGKSDNIDDTVDYFTLQQNIINLVEKSSFALLESLAEAVSELCLKDKRIQEASIELEKPLALQHVKTLSIKITRNNEKDSNKSKTTLPKNQS